MYRFYLIFLTALYLTTGSVAQAVESSSVPSDNSYAPTDPERVLVLYDNPMEEHTVISVLITRGYNVKIEEQLDAAIEVLKEEAARVGAHAVIILPPDHDKNVEHDADEDEIISAKAIRYKHFYY
jgi:predicted xylose isomerase-like sugar epimerase